MTTYLEPNQVPASLRGSYSGNKFQVEVCESVHIPIDAGLWDSGSRDLFSAIELSTGKQRKLPGQNAAPWGDRQAYDVKLEPDFAVIKHTIFQGKDLGLRFYIHPSNAAALLPAPSAGLTDLDKLVLTATRSYKSSYMGRDRYQMAREDYEGVCGLQGRP